MMTTADAEILRGLDVVRLRVRAEVSDGDEEWAIGPVEILSSSPIWVSRLTAEEAHIVDVALIERFELERAASQLGGDTQ